ncbi:MAG: DNA glycosylase AlkZ-like family protein [Candidatus Hodarchaeales archaeon]|jgi:uncharacterized protein YcaQ
MINSEIPTLTKEELKRILLVGCNLHTWVETGDEGIRKLIQTHGFVQLDPLSPAGRYHDYFFSARLSDYSLGQFERIAYTSERLVFETYFHNLNAIAVEHFPFFHSYTEKEHLGRYYSRLLHNLEELGGSTLLEEVYEHVKTHGPTKSSDLAKLGKADPKYASWKSSRNSGIALELLWGLGKLAVVERDSNFRKKYDLTERYITANLKIKKKYSEEERQLYRLKLKLKAFSVIPIGKLTVNAEGEVTSSKKQDFLLKSLILNKSSSDEIFPIIARMSDDSGYIIPSNWEELCRLSLDDEMRVIGPLDPVIWDRELLKRLFGFDYVWEVYKKVQDRVWGYYVYPLLYQGNFIGRIEAKYDKKAKILEFFNFQKEKGFKVDKKAVSASKRLFQRWKEMIGVDEMIFDSTVPKKMIG